MPIIRGLPRAQASASARLIATIIPLFSQTFGRRTEKEPDKIRNRYLRPHSYLAPRVVTYRMRFSQKTWSLAQGWERTCCAPRLFEKCIRQASDFRLQTTGTVCRSQASASLAVAYWQLAGGHWLSLWPVIIGPLRVTSNGHS